MRGARIIHFAVRLHVVIFQSSKLILITCIITVELLFHA